MGKKRPDRLVKHGLRRAWERYDLDLNKQQLFDLAAPIRRGKLKYIKRESNTRKLYKIPYEGQELYAIYSNKRRTIVTLLTPEQAREKY